MVKYKLIIEYYQKGNNNSQIATLARIDYIVSVFYYYRNYHKMRFKRSCVFQTGSQDEKRKDIQNV